MLACPLGPTFGTVPDDASEPRMCGDCVGVCRIQQGLPTFSANLGAMIASNFSRAALTTGRVAGWSEGVDLTVPVVVAALMVAMIVGGIGRALWRVGRRSRPGAVTRWQRVRNAGLRHVGEVGMAAAAVILIVGAWIGIQQKSVNQIRREEAVEACAEEYPRFLEWEQSGNSLDNWWNDAIPVDAAAKRATKKEFFDRCVEMAD